MVYTNYVWWFGGWCIIVIPALRIIAVSLGFLGSVLICSSRRTAFLKWRGGAMDSLQTNCCVDEIRGDDYAPKISLSDFFFVNIRWYIASNPYSLHMSNIYLYLILIVYQTRETGGEKAMRNTFRLNLGCWFPFKFLWRMTPVHESHSTHLNPRETQESSGIRPALWPIPISGRRELLWIDAKKGGHRVVGEFASKPRMKLGWDCWD